MKSILGSTKDRCFICGRTWTEEHHIYRGSNRKASDKNGFVVYLCPEHHRGIKGVHHWPELDRHFMEACQKIFEKDHSREEFMAIIGKNYLEE